MIQLTIPDFGELHLTHLVMDYNGTLACDTHTHTRDQGAL